MKNKKHQKIFREKIYIYGKNPLKEALKNKPETISKVFLSEENYQGEIGNLVKKLKIPFALMKSKKANALVSKDATHQGVIAVLNPNKLILSFNDFVNNLKIQQDLAIVILDELTDPQNVGAIIRSAAAFGISFVLLPAHRQAKITGAVVKASAGMVFTVPIVEITNVNYTIDFLKSKGFQIIALEGSGDKNLNHFSFEGPLVFIVGSEGFGIRKKTLEKANVKLYIPINPQCESLNASSAAAIVFYKWQSEISKKYEKH
jgi:23S rRNA (guanosine2251-2'-O)-methyltransferase